MRRKKLEQQPDPKNAIFESLDEAKANSALTLEEQSEASQILQEFLDRFIPQHLEE